MNDAPPLVTITHVACGEPAFLMEHKPKMFQELSPKSVWLLTGGHPEPFSILMCGSCGQRIRNLGPECLTWEGRTSADW